MRIRHGAIAGMCLAATACTGYGPGSTRAETAGSELATAEEGPVAPGADFDPGRGPAVHGEPSSVIAGRGGTAATVESGSVAQADTIETETGPGAAMPGEREAIQREEMQREEMQREEAQREMAQREETERERIVPEDEREAVTPGQPGARPRQGEIAQAESICPADIQGLDVRVTSIPSGGAIVFTAPGEQVDDLRDRLRRFAEIHREHRAPPSGEEAGLIDRAREIRVVEIPRGARVEVRLDDQARVRDLRNELREDAEQLRNGACPVSMRAS